MDLFIITAAIVGFYVAWNIGANDAANSMATSYGSRALTLKQIIIIAAVLEFAGATLFGKKVTHTIAKGIVPIELLDHNLVVYGALAALLSAGIWITISTYYHLPHLHNPLNRWSYAWLRSGCGFPESSYDRAD